MRIIGYVAALAVLLCISPASGGIEVPPPELVVISDTGAVMEFTGIGPASGKRIGYDYGRQVYGPTASYLRRFIIYNAGFDTLQLTDFTMTGTDAFEEFKFAGAQPAPSVGTGGLTVLTIACKPASAGTKSAVVTIKSNDPARPEYSIPLRAEAVSTPPTEFIDLEMVQKKSPKIKFQKKTGMYTIQWMLQVTNHGTVPSEEGIVRCWKSADLWLSSADPLVQERILAPIKPGKRKTVKFKITVDSIPLYLYGEAIQPNIAAEDDLLNNLPSVGLPQM